MKRFLISLFNPKPLTKEQKLNMLVKDKAKHLCTGIYEGRRLTSEEILYVVENLKSEVKALMIERANKHKEQAEKLNNIANEENNRANSALNVAALLG